MSAGPEALPDDIETLQAALVVARAEVAIVRAQQSDDQALIAHLKLQIEKLNRDRYGPRSERTARLLDQLELTLEELESSATENELAAEMAAAKTTKVASFTRKRPSRKPFPEHLARERVIVPGPTACSCCGGLRLSRLGEDITETLEVIPKSWKVIQHIREKFTCRDCEKISQAPAPFHVIARGWAGPSLLAMVLFEKFGQHQPLNRQAERYAKEGVPISLSTLADQVGGCTAALTPLFKRLEAYVLSADPPNEVIDRYRIFEVELVEKLTLLALQTAHHGSTSPRFASTQRNHGSRSVSTDFCNKICQCRKWGRMEIGPPV